MPLPDLSAVRTAVVEAAAWYAQNLRIVDPLSPGALVPLVLNDEQMTLETVAATQELAGLPVRIVVLKARKVGVSTWAAARSYRKCHQGQHARALVCAQDADSSSTLWRIARRYYDNHSGRLPVKGQRPSERRIEWSYPHDSSYEVRTAGAKALQRGDTIDHLHASEVAFWPHASETALSVFNAVMGVPGTSIIVESTANGLGGVFYDMWTEAEKRCAVDPADMRDYVPVFFSWLDHPRYSLPISAGEKLGDPDDWEKDLLEHGATPEQLNWRRRVGLASCNRDPELFCQEFPHTPSVAFRMTGRPAIPQPVLNFHRWCLKRLGEHVTETRVRFAWDRFSGVGGRVRCLPAGESSIAWRFWEPLQWDEEKGEYRLLDGPDEFCLFGDVMEGSLSDQSNPRSEPDFSAAVGLNRRAMRQACAFHGRPDADVFGEELLKCAIFLRRAWMTPELQGGGVSSLNRIRAIGYERLYQRQRAQSTPEAVASEESAPLYGWRTQTNNRDDMIDTWIAYGRPADDGDISGLVQVYDDKLVEEEEHFVKDKTGHRAARPGTNDDRVMAACGALQLHLRCPRSFGVGSGAAEQTDGRRDEPAGVMAHMVHGGRDTLDEDEDDGERTR
ncbi:MAG: hypothetical protein WC485_04825 [Opitutaceae bacterium]